MVRKTLSNDRDIEWGFLRENLPAADPFLSHALDFGPMPPSAPTSKLALELGYRVTAVGLENVIDHGPNFEFINADINTVDQPGRFDVILNISTTEHVGLGRYGDPLDPDGDLKAMQRLRGWMRPGGRQILTIPVGQDATIGHYHRVYGPERLWRLLENYQILKTTAWIKDDEDQWRSVRLARALGEPPTHLPVESLLHLYYAIGGFVLGRDDAPTL